MAFIGGACTLGNRSASVHMERQGESMSDGKRTTVGEANAGSLHDQLMHGDKSGDSFSQAQRIGLRRFFDASVLRPIRFLARRRAANQIRKSPLFDSSWYLAHNSDVDESHTDPALHYLLHGGIEGRDPGPDFSSSWYLQANADVRAAGVNPLLHYMRHGEGEGRLPAPAEVHESHLGTVRTDPIVVYQMGKVGSSTVQASLIQSYRSLGLDVPVYDIHSFNRIEIWEKMFIRWAKQGQHTADSLQVVRQARGIKGEIQRNRQQRWNLVTLVREPVARVVSAFFQALPELMPDWQSLYESGDLTIHELRELYFRKFNQHWTTGTWFDDQMRPVFGIDVYAAPFPIAEGYQIYPPRRNVHLLLIRLEDLDRVGSSAFRAYLGLDDVRFTRANVSREKDYSRLYQDWMRTPLPAPYVKRMYETKYARHFYAPDELEAFAHRWTHA